METMIRKHLARIMILGLAFVFAAGFSPQMSASVFADEGDPDISPGALQLAKNVDTSDAQRLWYGGRDWRVIAYDGKDATGKMITYQNPGGDTVNLYQDGVITLFQNDVIETSKFSDHGGSDWNKPGFQGYGANAAGEPSILRNSIEEIYLNGKDKTPAVMSAKEAAAIVPRKLPGYGYEWSSYTDQDKYDKNLINMNELDNALVWPLSHAEIDTVEGGIRVGPQKDYWLRSSGFVSTELIYVKYGAKIESYGNWKQNEDTDYENGVRPAFYLNKKSVVFTSAAFGGKESGRPGPNAMKKISENTDIDWKVTLEDSGHKEFKIDSVPKDMTCQETLTMQYSGAATGSNEFISAVIIDKDNKVTYYGRLKKCADNADASGEVTVTLKNKFNKGDKLYLFSEQTNGEAKTDYASGLKEIAVPEAKHDLDKTDAKDATCTDDGNSEYWTCKNCGLFFSDGNAKKQIKKDSWVIPAKGHTPVLNHGNKKAATLDNDGWIEVRCGVCDVLLGSSNIIHPKTFELSPSEYIYDGSAKKPDITVKDVNDKVIAGSNYAVTYKNNTNAGTATATVTFNDDLYTGQKDLTFTISKTDNPLAMKGKTAKVKYKKLKKKAQKLAVTKVITFTGKGQGKMTYNLISAKKKGKSFKKSFKIKSSTGKVTVKKGLEKGKYKLTVKAKAAGNNNYNASDWKIVKFTLKVK